MGQYCGKTCSPQITSNASWKLSPRWLCFCRESAQWHCEFLPRSSCTDLPFNRFLSVVLSICSKCWEPADLGPVSHEICDLSLHLTTSDWPLSDCQSNEASLKWAMLRRLDVKPPPHLHIVCTSKHVITYRLHSLSPYQGSLCMWCDVWAFYPRSPIQTWNFKCLEALCFTVSTL